METKAAPAATQESLCLAPELCNLGVNDNSDVVFCVDMVRAPKERETSVLPCWELWFLSLSE